MAWASASPTEGLPSSIFEAEACALSVRRDPNGGFYDTAEFAVVEYAEGKPFFALSVFGLQGIPKSDEFEMSLKTFVGKNETFSVNLKASVDSRYFSATPTKEIYDKFLNMFIGSTSIQVAIIAPKGTDFNQNGYEGSQSFFKGLPWSIPTGNLSAALKKIENCSPKPVQQVETAGNTDVIRAYMMFYAVGYKCAVANASFSKSEVNAMSAFTKEQISKSGMSKSSSDEAWNAIQYAVSVNTISYKDCGDMRRQSATIFPPSVFMTNSRPNPF